MVCLGTAATASCLAVVFCFRDWLHLALVPGCCQAHSISLQHTCTSGHHVVRVRGLSHLMHALCIRIMETTFTGHLEKTDPFDSHGHGGRVHTYRNASFLYNDNKDCPFIYINTASGHTTHISIMNSIKQVATLSIGLDKHQPDTLNCKFVYIYVNITMYAVHTNARQFRTGLCHFVFCSSCTYTSHGLRSRKEPMLSCSPCIYPYLSAAADCNTWPLMTCVIFVVLWY